MSEPKVKVQYYPKGEAVYYYCGECGSPLVLPLGKFVRCPKCGHSSIRYPVNDDINKP